MTLAFLPGIKPNQFSGVRTGELPLSALCEKLSISAMALPAGILAAGPDTRFASICRFEERRQYRRMALMLVRTSPTGPASGTASRTPGCRSPMKGQERDHLKYFDQDINAVLLAGFSEVERITVFDLLARLEENADTALRECGLATSPRPPQ
jgi:hypothetical protein